jgi:hypothetical protein
MMRLGRLAVQEPELSRELAADLRPSGQAVPTARLRPSQEGSVSEWRDIDDTAGTAAAIRGLGEVAAQQRELGRAVQLFGRSTTASGAVAAARTGPDEATLVTSWAAGRTLQAEVAGDVAVADGVGLA